ncbi:MAG TPA: penicillin-binding protein 2 [Candidatus Eremiobacteraceae bacterium]|nr:penicillin-binding protein 2 [Candidatus Eremiobacteraceae bacterium]
MSGKRSRSAWKSDERGAKIKQQERSRLSLRALVIFWAFFALCGLLVTRLFIVQIREGAGLAASASEEQRATFELNPKRGDIVDRFGAVFATTLPSFYVYVQPPVVKRLSPTAIRHEAAELAPVLHTTSQRLETAMTSNAPFVYLARNQPKSVANGVRTLEPAGVGAMEEPMGLRVAPQSTIGSTVVGFTGVDDQGLAGIEYQYNGALAGQPGRLVEETDAAGRPIPFGRRITNPAHAGTTIVLTIDRTLQYAADQILKQQAQRYHAHDGSIIILRARTGEILALSNWPDYDPNNFAAAPASAWKNQAVTDPYEPGSTFKLITATAALDSGRVSLSDTFAAQDELRVGGRIIHNADDGLMASGHARETLDEIVTYSHNVGAAQVALRVGKTTMYEYIQRFGFDEPTGVDVPGESPGIVGTPDDWWGSRLATIGFGQGVSVTPLALARAYAAIANGGMLMRPLIVHSLLAPDGTTIKQFDPVPVRRVMSSQTAAELLTILRDVVRRGTAKGVAIPGYALAGKTGTAQMVIGGTYVMGAYTSSFVGIVPADKPEYVILVKIDRPQGAYYGSIVAAPAFRELARRVLWREGVLPQRVTTAQDLGGTTRKRL